MQKCMASSKMSLSIYSIIGICSVTGMVLSTIACNIVPSFTRYVYYTYIYIQYIWPLASWHASPLHLTSTWPWFTSYKYKHIYCWHSTSLSLPHHACIHGVMNDAPHCIYDINIVYIILEQLHKESRCILFAPFTQLGMWRLGLQCIHRLTGLKTNGTIYWRYCSFICEMAKLD